MCDRDRCAPLREKCDRFLDELLCLRVDSRSRLVEDQDLRVRKNGTRYRKALAFTARKVFASRSDDRVVTVGHRTDEVVCSGQLRGTNDIITGCVLVRVGDVVRYRTHKDVGVLGNHRNASSQIPESQVTHVYPVDPHASLIGIVESRDEIDECRLAGAGASDDTEHLSRPNLERDVPQHRPERLVTECHMVELDPALRILKPLGVVGLFDIGHRVDDLQHTLRGVDAVGPDTEYI